MARYQLEASFSGEIEVRYYDARAPHVRAEHAERFSEFEARHWPFPVALVNGEVVSVGSVSPFTLFESVQAVRRGVPARRW